MTADPVFAALAAALAERYAAEGRAWPAFCAVLVLARGRLGVDRVELARRLGVAHHVVAQLERGLRHPALAPAALVHLAPDVDWSVHGVPQLPATGHSLRATRSRHPSAHRPLRLVIAPR
jgi:hypothetical protein